MNSIIEAQITLAEEQEKQIEYGESPLMPAIGRILKDTVGCALVGQLLKTIPKKDKVVNGVNFNNESITITEDVVKEEIKEDWWLAGGYKWGTM